MNALRSGVYTRPAIPERSNSGNTPAQAGQKGKQQREILPIAIFCQGQVVHVFSRLWVERSLLYGSVLLAIYRLRLAAEERQVALGEIPASVEKLSQS